MKQPRENLCVGGIFWIFLSFDYTVVEERFDFSLIEERPKARFIRRRRYEIESGNTFVGDGFIDLTFFFFKQGRARSK